MNLVNLPVDLDLRLFIPLIKLVDISGIFNILEFAGGMKRI
jgi:hypothetical protein